MLAAGPASDPFLPVLALTLLMTVGAALLLRKFRLPALPGYFLCGFLLAQSGIVPLGPDTSGRELLVRMGDLGVILLMFSIGIECSAHELRMLRKHGLAAGIYQMALSTVFFAAVAWTCGVRGGICLLWGMLGALSSTAVSLRLLHDVDRGEGPAARLVLGIALVQDLFVIGVLVLLPTLSASSGASGAWRASVLLGGKSLAFLAGALILSRYVIPRLLKALSLTRSRELFTLAVIAICAGIAGLGEFFGLGVSLGAFTAGVAVSGSVYSHRILADAAPFRDLFLTIFFLSVGALVDVEVLRCAWLPILGLTCLALLCKPLLTALTSRRAGVSWPNAWLAAAALSGVGEFAIVLARQAETTGLLTARNAQIVLAVTAFTLALSPLVLRLLLPRITAMESARKAPPARPRSSAAAMARRLKEIENHAILCGYGTVGSMLHKGLERMGIPVIIIELNSETVAALLKEGHAVLFADISQPDTLELAGIARARIIAITFPHAEIARTAITMARERNPDIKAMARARFPHEAVMLRKLGVDALVHDEREAGKKMLRYCARTYGPGRDELEILDPG